MEAVEGIWRCLSAIRAERPLIHNITNFVVMNSTANTLLAVGASPAMVECTDEVEELAGAARALVVNLGTISQSWVAAMRLATIRAVAAGVPWVLDPVAAGVLSYRTAAARDLMRRRPAAIRGNASEIIALAGGTATGKGVDSADEASGVSLEAARFLARDTGAAVAVTGAVDYVTDGERVIAVHNGHPMMTRVTGTGCAASAVVGAFLAVERDPLLAAAYALATFGIAGELAAERAAGPGSLQVALLDALYRLDRPTIEQRARLQ